MAYQTINPATGELLASYSELSNSDLELAIANADIEHGRNVATKIESGMVFINQPAWTSPELPFGGINNSGFGRELSERGFYEFVNEKLVNVAPSGAFPWGQSR
jgi:succinate-semialdehyde dehydrogenase/glutarate-semialdehyde dehydrogenase